MPVASRRARRVADRNPRAASRSLRSMSRGDEPRPRKVGDLFTEGQDNNLLAGRFGTERVFAWFQQRHRKQGETFKEWVEEGGIYRRDGHEWKVPMGVIEAFSQPLLHAQIVNRYPWYVTWRSPKTGNRLKKYFMTLGSAVTFVAEKAQYVDPHATIVCRHGIIIPARLRNKLPSPWKWCPCCMKPRKFYRVIPEQTFTTIIRDRETWEEKERQIPLLKCRVCGITNRDRKYRMSNQWWITRKIKPGVRRVKRRRKRGG